MNLSVNVLLGWGLEILQLKKRTARASRLKDRTFFPPEYEKCLKNNLWIFYHA
jgi:hypothetical protein